MNIQGSSASSGACLNVTDNATGANSHYAVTGTAIGGSSGVGGKFKGTSCGVQGYANTSSSTTDIRYGGMFTCLYGRTTNYGIWASAQGGTAYAGYFNGSIYTTGSYLPSDIKLKKNIIPMFGALDKILNLKPKTYQYDVNTYSSMNLPTGSQNGLIAQDVEGVLPEAVMDVNQPQIDADGLPTDRYTTVKSINYTALIPVLIAAIQDQQKQIDNLKKQLSK